MKIAHVVWGMKTGGVETMLVNIINEHVETDSVHLYIINDFIDEDIVKRISPKCKVIRLGRKPKSFNPIKIIYLNFLLRNYSPDIIHVHSYRVSKLIIGKWNIVRTIHGIDNVPDEYPNMKALYAISNAVKEFTLKQGFTNVIEIDNGIRVEDVITKQESGPTKMFRIVQVGRLYTPHKGQDILIRALSKLRDKGLYNFTMHFIGEGPSKKELQHMVTTLHLQDYVVFEGRKTQDEIYNGLCDYDVFVQPSRSEGFGLTVAEAVSAKLPVIVSDLPGPMEIISYGIYGMYFKNEDADNLADKLETILRGGYDYSMIEPAYEYVKSHYDVSITAKKYIEEYKKVISKK